MSDWKDRLIYPPLYLLILLAAIFFVYEAFRVGFERGEYVGKYEPHEQGSGAPAQEEESYDLAAMLEPSDELVGLGEELYNLNCATCHGVEGRGNGPKSAGLNPPPRDFVAQQFKQGGGTLQIYQTLATGVPGSSMASFSFLNPRELMTLSHYVRVFVPNPPADPPALVSRLAPAAQVGAAPSPAAAGDSTRADSAATAGKPQTAEPGRALPVAFAVERILAEQPLKHVPLVNPPPVYANLCAGCHAKLGKGAVVARKFSQIGSVYAYTRPLSQVSSSVVADYRAFSSFLATGLTGQPGHRFPHLSAEEVKELFESLRRAPGQVKQ